VPFCLFFLFTKNVPALLRKSGNFQGFTELSKLPGLYGTFQTSRALQDFPELQGFTELSRIAG